jgi:hypothetical protein
MATPDIDSNTTAYENQVKDVQSALETYGTEHVLGVSLKLGLFQLAIRAPKTGRNAAGLIVCTPSLPLSPRHQITVGNEYILNSMDASSSLATASAQAAIKKVLDSVAEVNTTIKGMNLDKQLPIGTSDAGSAFNTVIAQGIDYFQANGELRAEGGLLAIECSWLMVSRGRGGNPGLSVSVHA